LKNEIQKTWEMLMNNFLNLIVIISLLFIIGQADFLSNNIYISIILRMVILPLSIFLQLLVVHIIIEKERNEKGNIKRIITHIIREFEEVIIIIGLELLCFLIAIFSFIPIIPMLVVQTLFIFVWPIFIVERKVRFEVLIESTKLVFRNIKDLLKYLGLYVGIIMLISIIALTEGLDMTVLEKSFIICIRYFERFVTIFFTILVTRLYLQYREKN